MNVLIYSGPEVLAEALRNTISSLRTLLRPHYSVQTLTFDALTTQPWKASCALLVLPRCNRPLDPPAATAIRGYVESGGSLLSFTSGVISTRRPQTMNTPESRLLMEFSDRPSGMFTYPQFAAEGTEKPVVVVDDTGEAKALTMQGFPDAFTDLQGLTVSVLAKLENGPSSESVTGVKIRISSGRVAFWSANVEYPLEGEDQDKRRLHLLKSTLTSLSLNIPDTPSDTPVTHPLPQFLVASKADYVRTITNALAKPSPGSQLSVFKDDNDTFHFHQLSESKNLVLNTRSNPPTSNDPADWQPKQIILCPEGLPDSDQTPLFDLKLFFDALAKFREEQGNSKVGDTWGLGETLLYGEVVTSTQTMLDKNPRFHTLLPCPLVSLATYQLQGRGRGSNVWVSPTGCLQFSVLLRLSLSSFPASRLVFVQYLFALAVAEACREDAVLGERAGRRVRLKWPNDVYVVSDSIGGEGERKKVGGILVGTSFGAGAVDLIIGCGLNVLNEAPIFSLSQLLPPEDRSKLSLERTVACILSKFEMMWETFVAERGSFDSFMNLYLQRWFHSDELVTVTTVDPPQKVRIAGITRDHGLLHTVLEDHAWAVGGTDQFIDLQPDGNSFDMMQGLIKTKR